MFRSLLRVAVAFAALALPGSALAQVQPYGTNDYGGFRNVLPPGTNGFDNVAQALRFEATKAYPPHSNDQLGMYSSLTTAAPNIQASQIGSFFKDATFGVPAGQTASTESPEPGVTIVRDAPYGVPHIYGDTRAELEFGIGWATAEDRLFMIDVLRHAGEADLAQFAGGSNLSMDEGVWANEPYTQQDLQNQINYLATVPYGQQVIADATNFVDGINAYIAKAESPLNALTMIPAEYAAIGQPTGPKPFSPTDVVAIATLVGGIFGNGGGQQLSNALLYEHMRSQFGPERLAVAGSPEAPAAVKRRARHHTRRAVRRRRHARQHARHHRRHRGRHRSRAVARPDTSGFASFLSFVDPSDPESPTTVIGRRFPYQTLPAPSAAERATIALPDPGSVQWAQTQVAGGLAGAGGASTPLRQLLAFPRFMSNALLVSAAHSASGHALAVMGPQVSYFSPQILMEEDIHGPGIDADGASFPGTNVYVELGHGRDYAWSATSSGQNIIDTFAVPLCNPSGGTVSTSSDYYLLHGQCVQMETLVRQESWLATAADQTPPGSATLRTQRTAYGIVIARATVGGRPVAYCNLRSTYMHELDSAPGFQLFNDPAAMRNPQDFMNAAYRIGYTFNWFYADDQHVAYFNSGANPVRAPHTDPLFPSWAADAWPGLTGAPLMTPGSLVEQDTPQSEHPQAVDQPYLTSWNNQQALGYNDPATGQQYASIWRSQLLDQNINHYLAAGNGKMTLADLINAMGNAGTQDLRGVQVLPYALRILGHPAGLTPVISELQAWVASGAHRINREHPGASGSYDQTDAVRIMDAWWPLLVQAEFGRVLGSSLLGEVENDFPINDQPGHGTGHGTGSEHLGSAFDVGFYGIVQKDLRSVLGLPVSGPLNRVYCGGGSLAGCRSALESSLRAAIAESPQQVYPADSVCKAGDQMCSDSIQFRALGVITQPLIEWVNRPTFQQAVEVLGHGPR